MKKIIYILIGLIMCGNMIYGEGYEKDIEIGGDVKSIGEYYFDGETFGINAFDFKNKIYTIDAKDVSTSHLCAFGDYTYSWDENTTVIWACTSPSGHSREIFIIKKYGDKLKLIGVLAQKGNYIAEVKNPIDTNTKWQLADWDEDGKKEINKKEKTTIDPENNKPDIDTQLFVFVRYLKADVFPQTKRFMKMEKFSKWEEIDIKYGVHHDYNEINVIEFLNNAYIKDGKESFKNYLHNTYDIVLKELEGNTNIVEETSSNEPESFDQLIRVILPDLEIKEDEIREIGYIGYKFANIYKLTKDEQKLDNKKIIETAKKNSKNSPKILDIIEFNSKLHKLILKKGSYI